MVMTGATAQDMSEDVAAITKMVEEALHQISWDEEKAPDWESFFAPYLPEAILIPSARPVSVIKPQAFQKNMDQQRDSGALVSLQERPVGARVHVFGNVAVAQASFAAKINGGQEGFGVNSFLLVK